MNTMHWMLIIFHICISVSLCIFKNTETINLKKEMRELREKGQQVEENNEAESGLKILNSPS